MDPRTSFLSRSRASTGNNASASGSVKIDLPTEEIDRIKQLQEAKSRAIYYAEVEAGREYDDYESEDEDDYNNHGHESEEYDDSEDGYADESQSNFVQVPAGLQVSGDVKAGSQVPGGSQVSTGLQVPAGLQVTAKLKKVRGPTELKKLWAKHGPNNKVELLFNDKGQPCGLKTSRLTNFIGTLVKGKEVSLAATNRRKVPRAEKDKLWTTVQAFFNIDEVNKRWVMKSASKKWRAFKATLKRKFYDAKLSTKQNIDKGCKDRIPKKQWSWLVRHWKSEKAMALSMQNRNTRDAQDNCCHAAGSRSFAVVQDQMELKEGGAISRTELYCVVHTNKDGQPVDSYSAAKMVQIKGHFKEDPSLRFEQPSDHDLYSTIFPEAKTKPGHGLGLLV